MELPALACDLASFVRSAGDAIIIFDANGSLRALNDAARTMLELADKPESQLSMQFLIPGAESLLALPFQRALEGQVTRNLRLVVRAKQGSPRTLEMTMSPLFSAGSAVSGISCILRDISLELLLQDELLENLLAMQFLNEVGKEMTAIRTLDDLLGRIAAQMRRVIKYEILGIFIYDPALETMELKVAVGYAQETIERWRSLPPGTGLLGHAVREGATLVATDLPRDPRAISAKTADGRWTQSEVAIPLIHRNRLLGGLVVESCDPDYFKPELVQILETLGSQISVSIDNSQLFEQLLAKEQSLEADFALARDLQASMLPVSTPDLPGLEIASIYRPAESLGGDYYDFIWLDENQVGLTIGDVSGKGVAAAMTMAAARSALRFASRLHSSPSQVLYHVNRRLFRDTKKRTYISLFYGVLDIRTRICRWSNGGHFPPILIRADKSMELLEKGGMPLALFDKARYDSGVTRLNNGDVVCFYTDGIVEARNLAGEEFGRERIEELLAARASQSAREILRGLMTELKKFTRGTKQHDDIAAIILKAV